MTRIAPYMNNTLEGYVGYAYNPDTDTTTVSVTGSDVTTPEVHLQNKIAYQAGQTTTLMKRGWAGSITWASYEYNNGNQDLWDQFPKEGDEFEMLSEDFSQYVGENVAQKCCICFGDSGDIASQIALHDEIYFDAYGGVDNECDDNLCNTYQLKIYKLNSINKCFQNE